MGDPVEQSVCCCVVMYFLLLGEQGVCQASATPPATEYFAPTFFVVFPSPQLLAFAVAGGLCVEIGMRIWGWEGPCLPPWPLHAGSAPQLLIPGGWALVSHMKQRSQSQKLMARASSWLRQLVQPRASSFGWGSGLAHQVFSPAMVSG